eukprot:scaffold428_cov168-Ochromonas_danica.AAC.17
MIASNIRDPLDHFCCCCVLEDNDMVDDNRFLCWPRKVGKSILCYGRRKSVFPYHCLVGPDWCAVVFVYFAILAAHGVILGVASPLGWPPILIGAVGGSALLVAYSVTVFSDPGIIYKNDYPVSEDDEEAVSLTQAAMVVAQEVDDPMHQPSSSPTNARLTPAVIHPTSNIAMSTLSTGRANSRFRAVGGVDHQHKNTMECGQCQFHRPTTARHCSYCGVCIDDLDHHCPWSGKCIGKRNLKAFYSFLHLLCFQFYYLLGVLIYYIIFAVLGKHRIPHGPDV